MKYLWKIINRPFQLVWWCLLKSSSQMAENRIPVITDQGTPDTSISTSLRIKGLSYSRSSLEEAFLEDSFLVCPFLAGSPSRGKKHRSLLHRKRFVHRERKKEREIRRGERDRERERKNNNYDACKVSVEDLYVLYEASRQNENPKSHWSQQELCTLVKWLKADFCDSVTSNTFKRRSPFSNSKIPLWMKHEKVKRVHRWIQ